MNRGETSSYNAGGGFMRIFRRKRLRGWRLIRRCGVGLIACLVIGCALMGCWANTLLLHPSRGAILADASESDIATPVGNMQMWGVDTDPADGEPQAYVLGFVGNGSRAEIEVTKFSRYFQRHPVRLLVMNYPGFGDSEGKAHLASIAPAALAVYDSVGAEANGKPIFVMGHSMGTTVALYVGRMRPVAGLILHNPPPLRQLILGRFGWWNLWIGASSVALAVPTEMESLENEKYITKPPAIFLMAGRDTLVTPPYQKMVGDVYRGPKRLIHLPEYGHNDPVDCDDLPRVLDAVDWMWGYSFAATTPAVTAPATTAPAEMKRAAVP
jgi:uncharacterized protein